MTTQQVPTTDQTRQAWDSLASGFDDFVTTETMPLAQEVLDRLGLPEGSRLLDVAAGTGALSIPAARMGLDVLATDVAPAMLARLDARARAERLSLRAAVMDGQELDLADDTFDAAVSVNGVSLFPDLARGLAELTRVTRPGGRVVVVAFGPLPKAEFIAFFIAALRATGPEFTPPTDPPPLPFQVADPEVLRGRLYDAGLRDIRVDTTTWDMTIESADHHWQVFTSSNPIGAQLVAGLSEQQRAEVKQVLGGMLRERSGGAPGAVLHAAVNIGVGAVPA
jgi:ubiquinone/menaquinone biosynthesis C-methylase UbiE